MLRGLRCQLLGDPGERRIDFAVVQPVQHECYVVEIVVERVEKICVRKEWSGALGQAALHEVSKLTQPHRARHPCTAFESM